MSISDWHVFVGSEVGLLKGVDIEKNSFSNLNFSGTLTKDDEITSICWEDSSEKKIYLGLRDQTVKTYDCELKNITSSRSLSVGEGPIKGLYTYKSRILTGVESGIVKLWNDNSDEGLEINTGGNLCRLVQNPFRPNCIATGGEENDLKVWNLQTPTMPIFAAKNVRNDFLDVRVPVWVTDAKFKHNDNIITCTRHHQVRMYDPRAQRRPVIDMKFEQYPLMCMALVHNEYQVIVGSSRGRMALIDFRRQLLVHVFKGFAGSIRSVQCHPDLPLVASCGLDRFLRIHDLNTHKLLKKIYLKTRLNCLLMRNSVADLNLTCVEVPKAVKKKVELPPVDDEEEKIWDKMHVIGDGAKKKRLSTEDVSIKNKKQKLIIKRGNLEVSEAPAAIYRPKREALRTVSAMGRW